ncbi:MAG TPA: tagaturonate epimerase family protein, partial [Caldilineaceae bacterium]|nr:tagaturonate epimerase family protein [Caldilineaceae bacterium]
MITELLSASQASGLSQPDAAKAATLAAELSRLSTTEVYPSSIVAAQGLLFFLGRKAGSKQLGCVAQEAAPLASLAGQTTSVASEGNALILLLGPTSAANAATLRTLLPFLQPRPWGLRKSAGCGDRLGLATPGHIRAFRQTFGDAGAGMAAILAQQSIRENARAGRTPQEVVDDAMWGVFQEGWQHGYGADADHLKTSADVDVCAAAGYTFYTVDPGEYVDDEANSASVATLRQKVAALPWERFRSNPEALLKQLADQRIDLGELAVTLSVEDVLRAAAKYGKAVAHTVFMYSHLIKVMGERPCELEMSVDETETVTSLAEHIYIAAELQRLAVPVVSLAPRYVGRFEKGVDYIGNPDEFARSFAQHVAVAKTFGPYKLSLHSGSDKFTIYPLAAQLAGDLVHLKTAGTSYLEALRAIAQLDPALFRRILDFALERYPIDRASYHISAVVDKMPVASRMPDGDLPTLLDDFHARQILHVTFGSVLNHPTLRQPF